MIARVENSHTFTMVNLVLSYVAVIHIEFLRSAWYQHRNLFCGTALVPERQRFESSAAQRSGNYERFVRQLLASHFFHSSKQTYSVTPCSSARPTMAFSELIDNYCVDLRNIN